MKYLSEKQKRKLRNSMKREVEKMSKEEILDYLVNFMQSNWHSNDSDNDWGKCHYCYSTWWEGHLSNCKIASFLIVYGDAERVKYLEEERERS